MSEDQPRRPESLPPEQQDNRPGHESEMGLKPQSNNPAYKAAGKLEGKVALITGGDSGIGRAVAIHFAKEGADVAIVYLEEHEDAAETERLVSAEGRRCLIIAGDIGDASFCDVAIKAVLKEFGKLDILVNNAAEQHPQAKFEDITPEQLERTFRTNIFSMFYLSKAALPSLEKGGTIINTASVTAFKGNPMLVDYSSTKGAIVAFTRSLSMQLAERGIRVNAVAPGPIWTPLIPSTFPSEKVEQFGKDTPMKRPGQPEEVAPAYVFLASADASYITGQTVHVNGGSVVNA
jgi:NAD(P)-dependent dehydrogenase (short-subunit alcohol dehydrogenase family)